MTILSGHQPVYLPWLGLFHKLSLCDIFVYMDTVQYLRQDWNNRNKIRTPHGSFMLTVPIDKKKSGQSLHETLIKQDDKGNKNYWQTQHFTSIKANYIKTPFLKDYIQELEHMYMEVSWNSLVDLCWSQFGLFRSWLGLEKQSIVRMSEREFLGNKDDLVLDHCMQLGGSHVVFGIHGKDYVDINKFKDHNIRVYYQKYQHPIYRQRFEPFEPYMCILDLLFNHGPESCSILLDGNHKYENIKSNSNLWL